MLFNSIEFAIFLPTVFILYWFVFKENIKNRNFFLVAVSYIFYGWWDWRFLSLIFFSSLVDYTIGVRLNKTDGPNHRKVLLILSLVVNLGLLGFFKYYNFFVDSFADAFTLFGSSLETRSLNIVLPVGISFYTFQTLSYTIDVYRKQLKPTHDFIAFLAFVSFFPQLVAGPIERATNLLPQFFTKKVFNYQLAHDGIGQIIWGLFKKVVIADTAATFVNDIFANYETLPGSTLFLGGVLFAFQIYGDFSGYSDIAIGTAKLFGFSLMRNFAYPYFSRDIAEFWRRWHISLSTWFRDYVYIPLGGSRGGKWMKVRNTMTIFIVSGFWHGANWTFLFWGFLNGLYFLPLLLAGKNRKNIGNVSNGRSLPSIIEFLQILFTFFITVIAWIFFRAENIGQAFTYLNRMFFIRPLSQPDSEILLFLPLLLIFIVIEWIQRNKEHAFRLGNLHPVPKYSAYFLIIFLISGFSGSQNEFIYFQF